MRSRRRRPAHRAPSGVGNVQTPFLRDHRLQNRINLPSLRSCHEDVNGLPPWRPREDGAGFLCLRFHSTRRGAGGVRGPRRRARVRGVPLVKPPNRIRPPWNPLKVVARTFGAVTSLGAKDADYEEDGRSSSPARGFIQTPPPTWPRSSVPWPVGSSGAMFRCISRPVSVLVATRPRSLDREWYWQVQSQIPVSRRKP